MAVGTCLVLGYGARIVLDGRMTAGSLVVFVMYLSNMYKPMRDLSKMTDTDLKSVRGLRTHQGSARNRKPRARFAAGPPRSAISRKIELDRCLVLLTQPDVPVLKNVSLTILPGQTAAFVGPTGAGKCTIISLVARFLRSNFRMWSKLMARTSVPTRCAPFASK